MTTLVLKNNLPSISNLNNYIQYVMSIPNLNETEERKLFEEFKYKNSLASAQTLILSQLKTVVRIAYSFKNYGIPQEDLIQEGNIGLMKAVKNFDITQKVRLYSYALLWIKAEMQSFILKNWKLVKIGTTKNLKKLFFNFRQTQKEMIDSGISKNQMYSHIAKKLNVEEAEVKEIEAYFNGEDYVLSEDFEDSDTNTLQTQLVEYKTPQDFFEEAHDLEVNAESISNALKSLNKNQREVIKFRYYDEEKKTHKEISKILGISSERVRQIEMEALNKLKQQMITV